MKWKTRFVFEDQTELRWKDLPAITVGGGIMLHAIDTFDDSKVPKFFRVKRVIFNVYEDMQYVHLEETDGGE